ncbi:MAG: hypothetical protein NUV74_02130 [Candidatus Brocadiaceae bacterium]|nr:hypothetical protein [Candidatus Brocadiaceae bacterium]
MNKRQRENTSKLLYDIVRYSIAGIIFINFAPGKGFSWISIIAGGIIVIFAYLIAFWLDGKGE